MSVGEGNIMPLARQNKSSFFLLCCYLLFEYGRPQNLIPGLALLHLPLLMQFVIVARLIINHSISFADRQVKLLTAMVLLMGVHVPLATNNFWAFWMTYTTAMYFIAGMGILFLTQNLDELLRVIRFWTLTFIVLAFVGFVNHGTVPGTPFLGDENDFSLAMNFAFPFIVFHMILSKSQRTKILYLCATGLALLASTRAMSRGGFVGFIPVAFYCWLRLPKKIVATIGAALFLFIVAIQLPEGYWEEISTITAGREESTADLRMYYWEIGWEMFLDNPILGVGPGNFPWRIEEYEPAEGRHGRHHGGRPAHSLYFTLLPELGLLGTGLFFAMLWRFLKNRKQIIQLCRAKNEQWESDTEKDLMLRVMYATYMMDGAMVAYLVTGTFLSVLYYPYLWNLVAVNAALHFKIKEMYPDLGGSA